MYIMDRYPKVAIIILNWNGWKDTIECLESIQGITYPNYQVVVVDNGSTDDSIVKIKEWADGKMKAESKFVKYNLDLKPVFYIEYDRKTAENGGIKKYEKELEKHLPNRKLVIIQTSENLGFSAGNNIGIKYALDNYASYVLLLNNDTFVDKQFLKQLVQTAINYDQIGILGPKVLLWDKPNTIQVVGATINLWTGRGKILEGGTIDSINSSKIKEVKEVDWVTGSCMLIKKDVFKIIGLFDERFFLFWEEVDFCLRAGKAGFQVVSVPHSKIWHKGARSSDKTQRSYHLIKSRAILMKKHSHIFQLFIFLFFYILSAFKNAFIPLVQGNKSLSREVLRGFFHGLIVLILKGK